ncbi:MAG: carbohydrate ABC transporter permease, partial [Acidimicrobiia bacterium]|nr:carbohydrate ABC transporter permease [Acidimicrobiia bacterium]
MARRVNTGIGSGRPSPFVYGILAVVLIGSMFPFYWSFLSGSGDHSTIYDVNMSWWPGGNCLAYASEVIHIPAVKFWKA